MDDRTLLRAVLFIAVLSLALNIYTLYEVRSQEQQTAAPANLIGLGNPCGQNTVGLCLERCMEGTHSPPKSYDEMKTHCKDLCYNQCGKW